MDWSRGHTIGHGASAAAVSTATLRSSGEILAVKSVELFRSEPIQREHKILSTLNHPHIIGHRGCDITIENSKAMFNLMMEYAPDGTLADAICRSGPGLDESMISHYVCGIVKGLEYLHSRGIVHCDIKGSNILLSQGEAKIADFGCAKAADEAAIGGTPMYMSPEVARGDGQGFSADIWAVGCTIIEMATGNSPWPTSISTLHRIAFSGETPEVPDFLSDLGKDFLSKCLRVDPEERWTAGQLLQHPFLDETRFGHVKQSIDSTCSPTCVLDQGIWSSIEEEYSEAVCEVDYGGLLDGPMERMKELCVNSGRDNWEWGETWITVRDSENVNISINGGGKFKEQSLVLGRNCNLQRDTGELVLDQFQFL
ncbi:mitogen-activated protein kinase kinase kinase anp1 [Phtheirospermum japonicum]|uniref:Mitogen-activated protein kinase kinase kinase anp1 n=1 Tax=Phtheirospermum japonicum TaxID=374723 RepID=A0A830BBY9_9LAMI|nr:mitogen-activated protein kinase kinase kinase anp1 [Phtheirospermum japonicum]